MTFWLIANDSQLTASAQKNHVGPRIGLRSWPASLAAIALADEERIDVSREILFPGGRTGRLANRVDMASGRQ